jgi:hypothetical protein
MAVPAEAKVFAEALDPADIVDFEIDLSPLLEGAETIATHTETIPPESALLGLEFKTTGGYATSLTGNILRIWLGIADAQQSNAAFATGVTLPIELTITTNSTPARKKQRTVAVKVIQR